MGVTLQGPFDVSGNAKPVSPILWFCTGGIKFTKPVQVTLPHFIDCSTTEQAQKLAFFKASHETETNDPADKFVFEPASDRATFQVHGNEGTLFTTHSCFLCICHKVPEEIVTNANYCLISAVPEHTSDAVFKVEFCATYFLDTCIEVSV